MGWIVCDKHGGNIAALVSKYHYKRIIKGEKVKKGELISITVHDKENMLNGIFLVDPFLVEALQINSLTIDIQNELSKFEKMFEKLKPVCPKCFENYRKDE